MNINIRSRSRIVPRMAAAPPIQRRMTTGLPMAAALPSAEVAQRRMIWKDVAELENEEDSDHDRNEGQEPLYSDVDWDDYMAPGDSASTDRILPLKYYRGFKKHEFIQMEGLNWKKAMIPERSWIRFVWPLLMDSRWFSNESDRLAMDG
eukprot:618645_1